VKVPHSPDFTPTDFHLKKYLACQKFHEDEEVKNKVTTWLHAHAMEFQVRVKDVFTPFIHQ
jgi:hypothetical protein